MTDKERLERIIQMQYDGYTIWDMGEDDLVWLIEQAGRVQELESEIENWQKGRFLAVSTFVKEIDLKKRVQELEKQNKRYREALEFYANKINYLTFIENGKSNIEHDQGEKARKALEESE